MSDYDWKSIFDITQWKHLDVIHDEFNDDFIVYSSNDGIVYKSP